MRLQALPRRTLRYHWRTNLAVALGVVVATAALTGALLVGDSMRASLRDAALGRLGRVTYAVVSNRYVRTELADDLAATPVLADAVDRVCPAILLSGAATHAETRARVERVTVFGVDQRFWALDAAGRFDDLAFPAGRAVILNEPLARELGARVGDDVLLRVGKRSAISTETLLGRRANTTLSLRLTVHAVVPAEGLGAFALRPRQISPKNAYVPLPVLQRGLDQAGRVNTLLVGGQGSARRGEPPSGELLQRVLQRCVTVEDVGLNVRVDDARGYVALESESLLLTPSVEDAARAAAQSLGVPAAGVLAYLANEIVAVESRAALPYSTVAAIEPEVGAVSPLTLADGRSAPALQPEEILLNEWAADDLGVSVGERIRFTYYLVTPFGQLETRQAAFTLRGVLRLDGVAADPGFVPAYPGVTDADSVADWDPPFPVDLRRIREKDEEYWQRYRTAPKAFVSLADGQRLWAEQDERFGRLTSIRIYPGQGRDLAEFVAALERELLSRLDVAQIGLSFEPVRAQAAAASAGSTDFGGLFIGFSFFLIVSAAMLVALLFRLGVERRAGEIGTLLATGFAPRTVTKLLLTEGALIAGAGGAVGVVAALGYAWLMLAGLRSWWSAAVNAPFLRLDVSGLSLVIGYVASFVVALVAIVWSLRGLTHLPTRALLSGGLERGLRARGPGRLSVGVALGCFALAGILVGLAVFSDALSQAIAFFGSGVAALVACLALLTRWLSAPPGDAVYRAGGWAWARLGIRNAPRHRGRSVLTAALVACATFVIIALQAFRLETEDGGQRRDSGTGGFALLAEAASPLPFDLNTAEGRGELNIAPEASETLADVAVVPFRLRAGDEASCLNLYRPRDPRILGATDAMIRRGGFRFGATLTESAQERDNPWTLLRRTFDDGAIPAIGDEASVLWQLHLGLGKDLIITDERGRDVRLRLVGLLKGSVLQGELVVAEAQFRRLFPSISGYGYFLIETPPGDAQLVAETLERELEGFGFDATTTHDRLNELFTVQNTYLSTFQTLGGIGLILGTLGLTAVLLRNVWERRSELALLQALGFPRPAIGWIVLSENAFLVAAGLLAGLLPAIVSVAPHIVQHPAALSWSSVGIVTVGVFVVGVGSGAAALIPALRAPLLPALRSE